MRRDVWRRYRRTAATAAGAAAIWLAAAAVLPRAQEQGLAARLFARYAAGDHEEVARELSDLENYDAFLEEVVDRGDAWEPRAKAGFLLEGANAAWRRVPIGVYRGGHGSALRQQPRIDIPQGPSWQVVDDLLDLAVGAVGGVGPEDPFVQAWVLASLSLIEGADEGAGLQASELGETMLTRHVRSLGELIASPLRHMALALAYEKSVWHGVRWEWPAIAGKRSPATARVRGPVTRNFAKAVNLAIAELKAAMAYPEVRAEAEVRLGQVLAMRDADGDRDTALGHLRGARAHAPAPDVAYLSHLFEGRALEARGNAPGAMAAYRTALAIKPHAQAARLGLAGLLFVEGQVDEAGALVEAALDEPDQLDDPWALYFYGRYGEWPERLAAMREALR